jgi:hypothetical protein
MAPLHSLKVPAVQRPDYTVTLEQWADMTFAHVDVRRWTAPVCRAFKADFDALYALHGGPLYATATDDNTKLQKFIGFCGGKPWGRGFDIDGAPVIIFRRD